MPNDRDQKAADILDADPADLSDKELLIGLASRSINHGRNLERRDRTARPGSGVLATLRRPLRRARTLFGREEPPDRRDRSEAAVEASFEDLEEYFDELDGRLNGTADSDRAFR